MLIKCWSFCEWTHRDSIRDIRQVCSQVAVDDANVDPRDVHANADPSFITLRSRKIRNSWAFIRDKYRTLTHIPAIPVRANSDSILLMYIRSTRRTNTISMMPTMRMDFTWKEQLLDKAHELKLYSIAHYGEDFLPEHSYAGRGSQWRPQSKGHCTPHQRWGPLVRTLPPAGWDQQTAT